MGISSYLTAFSVMLGGALGAVCRVLSDQAVAAAMGGHFPLGILCINMAGSFAMGLLSGVLSGRVGGKLAQAFLGTGFLGGFTTFSSFALDTVRLWEGGHQAFSLLNIGLNAVLCVGLAASGWKLARAAREKGEEA